MLDDQTWFPAHTDMSLLTKKRTFENIQVVAWRCEQSGVCSVSKRNAVKKEPREMRMSLASCHAAVSSFREDK